MADLLGNDIGLNYKGLLNLDTTINIPLDGTLRVVTDGEGDSSPLYLSTTAIGLGTTSIWDNTNGRLGIGTTSPQSRLQVTTSGTGTMLFNGAVIQQTDSYFYLRNNNGQFYFQNAGATTYMSLISGKLGINVTATAQLDIEAASATVGLYVKGAASTDIARFYTSGGSNYAKFESSGALTLSLNTYLSTTSLWCDQINDNGNFKTILQFGNYGGYSNTDFIINTANATITIGAAITQYQFLKFDTAMTAGANNQTMIGARVNATFVDNGKTGLTKYIQEWAVAAVQKMAITSTGGITNSNLPIGSSGLSTGQWYVDTAANVLANADLVLAVKQ